MLMVKGLLNRPGVIPTLRCFRVFRATKILLLASFLYQIPRHRDLDIETSTFSAGSMAKALTVDVE